VGSGDFGATQLVVIAPTTQTDKSRLFTSAASEKMYRMRKRGENANPVLPACSGWAVFWVVAASSVWKKKISKSL
jgi:hypothetical protein